MRIGELANQGGCDVETIRFYERGNLLDAPARQANGYRSYGPAHLERLVFIRHCRALDMPLTDVKRLLDFVAHPEADCRDIDQLIEEQLARVRERLKSMHTLEKQLAALRNQCAVSYTASECGIYRSW
ncbi:MAG: Cd(II)/Pb(II)-responsive transcriptional regulator [Sulfuriferula sp.]